MSENTSQDIQNTARTAANTAKAVKTTAKAAGKAASGNYIGAAKDLLSDEHTRKVIIIAILVPAMFLGYILFAALYVFPMAMYEALQELFANAKAEFWREFYSAEHSGVVAIAKGIGAFAQSLWNGLWDKITNRSDSEHANTQSEFGVATEQEDLTATLQSKIELTKEKYSTRIETIKEEIESQAANQLDRLSREAFERDYNSRRPDGYDKYDGASWNESGITTDLSDLQSIYYVALYSLLMDNDFAETRTVDYLKWLGWGKYHLFGWNEDKMVFNALGTEVSVPGWTGTYMLQYLTDEMLQNSDAEAQEAKKEAPSQPGMMGLGAGSSQDSGTGSSDGDEQPLEGRKAQIAYDEKFAEVSDEYKAKYGTSAIDLMTWVNAPKSVTALAVDGENDENWNLEESRDVTLSQFQAVINSLKDQYVILPSEIDTASQSAAASAIYPVSDHSGDYTRDSSIISGILSDQSENGGENDPDMKGEIESNVYWEQKIDTYQISHTATITLEYLGNGWYFFYGADSNIARAAIQSYFSDYTFSFNGSEVQFFSGGYSFVPFVGTISFSYTYSTTHEYTYYECRVSYKKWHYYKVVSYTAPIMIAPRVKTAMLEISGVLEGDYMDEREAFVHSHGMVG